jgi:hypothetical protein
VPVFSNVESKYYCKPEGCILASLNEAVMVECSVKGARTSEEVIMSKNDLMLTNAIHTHKDKLYMTYTYVKYSFVPTRSDIDTTFKCMVKNQGSSEFSSASVMAYVSGM